MGSRYRSRTRASAAASLSPAVPRAPAARSPPAQAPNVIDSPPASTPATRTTLSLLSPYTMDREPDELLPTMPPMVAWSTVEVSGPNSRPCGAAAALSAACTTPGWTRAVRASPSIARMRSSLKQSTTMPGPIAWPARLEAAPRATTGRPVSAETAAAAARSSGEAATTTTSGTIR